MVDEHNHGWKGWEESIPYFTYDFRFCGEFGCCCIEGCCYQKKESKKAVEEKALKT